MNDKIVSFTKIINKIEKIKQEKKKLVFCYGLFNFLHIGHIRYLKKAKCYGDILIVSIIPDRSIMDSDVLLYDENLRAESISSLGYVDYVFINPFNDIFECIEMIRPDSIVIGSESKNNLNTKNSELSLLIDLLKNLGIELYIAKDNNFTSTNQINRHNLNMPEEIQNYLYLFKQRYSINDLYHTIDDIRNLKVLVIGDTILDEYLYCTAIGKSSKDPILALKYESNDLFAGGVLAVANHVAGFTNNVDLITVLGEKDTNETFINSKLKKCIEATYIFKPNVPTLIKRRFIDGYSMNKLLEVYIMDDSTINDKVDYEFNNFVQSKIKNYDIIIVADFGHGAINMKLKNIISNEAPYLAVNAQSNAGNRGFNNITKYPTADFISMAEHEIRMEMRNLKGSIRKMMSTLRRKMNCQRIIVTRGRKGCMIYNGNDSFVQVPSFAKKEVDRIGAGDALFAITSLASARNAPCEVIGFLGNVVGALSVEIMGNQKSIGRNNVMEYLSSLLDT